MALPGFKYHFFIVRKNNFMAFFIEINHNNSFLTRC